MVVAVSDLLVMFYFPGGIIRTHRRLERRRSCVRTAPRAASLSGIPAGRDFTLCRYSQRPSPGKQLPADVVNRYANTVHLSELLIMISMSTVY